jgi:hypothetical protein
MFFLTTQDIFLRLSDVAASCRAVLAPDMDNFTWVRPAQGLGLGLDLGLKLRQGVELDLGLGEELG